MVGNVAESVLRERQKQCIDTLPCRRGVIEVSCGVRRGSGGKLWRGLESRRTKAHGSFTLSVLGTLCTLVESALTVKVLVRFDATGWRKTAIVGRSRRVQQVRRRGVDLVRTCQYQAYLRFLILARRKIVLPSSKVAIHFKF